MPVSGYKQISIPSTYEHEVRHVGRPKGTPELPQNSPQLPYQGDRLSIKALLQKANNCLIDAYALSVPGCETEEELCRMIAKLDEMVKGINAFGGVKNGLPR